MKDLRRIRPHRARRCDLDPPRSCAAHPAPARSAPVRRLRPAAAAA